MEPDVGALHSAVTLKTRPQSKMQATIVVGTS